MRWVLLLLALGAVGAHAHDSWFEAEASPRATEVRVKLGTGAMYPKMQSSVGDGALAKHGCRRGSGPRVPLDIVRDTPTALELRARWPVSSTGLGTATCWAQLVPFELEGIKPELIELYFKEIGAPPSVRETWAALAARGLPWKERYVKHARIELFDASGGAAAAAEAVAMGMDIVIESPSGAPKAGQTIVFVVLRDGAPLPDQAIELRSASSPLGLWLKTDASGRAQSTLPLPGSWLLRGTDLRVSVTDPERWDSRFVTLAFRVRP